MVIEMTKAPKKSASKDKAIIKVEPMEGKLVRKETSVLYSQFSEEEESVSVADVSSPFKLNVVPMEKIEKGAVGKLVGPRGANASMEHLAFKEHVSSEFAGLSVEDLDSERAKVQFTAEFEQNNK